MKNKHLTGGKSRLNCLSKVSVLFCCDKTGHYIDLRKAKRNKLYLSI